MTEPRHEQRAHSELGASGAYRWMKCPGSIALSRGIEDEQTVYAAEGTAAHELAERVLRASMDGPAHAVNCIGERIVVGNHVFDVDEEMAEAVQLFVDVVLADYEPGDTLLVERGFDLSHVKPGMFGTNDALVYKPASKKLIVFDYKHGKGYAVEVVENPQLLYYGLGAAVEAEWPVDEIELVIVQPRAPHADGPVRRWSTDPMALLGWAEDLRQAAEATEDPFAKLEAGEWCGFCRAAGICPALRDRAKKAAKIEFAEAPSEMTGEQIAEVMAEAGLIADYVKAVGAEALRRATAGEKIPGYKLVQKRAVRRWVEIEGLAQEIQRRFGLDDDELFKPQELRTPAQLEKLLPKSDRAELAEFVEAISSGVSLARIEDRRAEVSAEALRGSAQTDFDD